jgi:hypothetical protein
MVVSGGPVRPGLCVLPSRLPGCPLVIMLTQLAEWTRLGFLAKTSHGRYALPAPASATADAGP